MVTRVVNPLLRPFLLIAPPALLLFMMFFALLFLFPGSPLVAAPNSIFSVTKTEDSSDGLCDTDCSLREAVGAANANPGPDTITLPPGTYTLVITGSDNNNAVGDLDSHGPLTILGSGADLTVIDADQTDRALHALTGTLTISGVTVSHGFAVGGSGGGILANAGLVLSSTTIFSNRASFDGGGIAVFGTLTISDTRIQDNESLLSRGGGAFISGTVSLAKSEFLSNTAQEDGGGVFLLVTTTTLHGPDVAQVASISQRGVDNIPVTDVTFMLNRVLAGQGAALLAQNGNPEEPYPTIRFTRSTIRENDASGGCGGGITIVQLNTAVSASTFNDNMAQAGAAICVKPTDEVGEYQYPKLEVIASTFLNNVSFTPAGAIAAEKVEVEINANYFCHNSINHMAILGSGLIVHNFITGNSALAPAVTLDAEQEDLLTFLSNSFAGSESAPPPPPFERVAIAANGEGTVRSTNNIVFYGEIVYEQTNGVIEEDYNLYKSDIGSGNYTDAVSGEVVFGPHSLEGNPNFSDIPTCDLRITRQSDAIDRGIPREHELYYADHLLDILFSDREQDGDGDGNAEIDIGAHEFVAEEPGVQEKLYLPHTRS